MASPAASAIQVRIARLKEHDAIAALWSEVDALHARLVPGFFAAGTGALSQAVLAQILAKRDATVLVAEVEGAIAGCIHVELYDTPPEPGMRRRRRAHVERLVVLPGRRRRGVGRRLMAAAAAWGQALGATQVVLTVWEGNQQAERFYRQLGYRPVSHVYGFDLP